VTADGSDSARPGTPAPEPGPVGPEDQDESSVARVIGLSDGVVAIALTLLILSIDVPSPQGLRDPDSISQLASALEHTIDGWISYLISFYVIAQFWLIHRRVFRGVRGHSDGLAGWNFVFLFTISVMPFASDLIGKYPDNPLPVMILSVNMILANVAMHAALTFARGRGMLNARGVAALQAYRSLEGIIALSFFALAIPLALVSPVIGKLCWIGLAVAPRLAALITSGRGPRPAA
jgi:uncharacterized membrane protein